MLERKVNYKKHSNDYKRGGKRGDPRDLKELAFSIVQQATGQAPKEEPKLPE